MTRTVILLELMARMSPPSGLISRISAVRMSRAARVFCCPWIWAVCAVYVRWFVMRIWSEAATTSAPRTVTTTSSTRVKPLRSRIVIV
jgi:hypothetical protein